MAWKRAEEQEERWRFLREWEKGEEPLKELLRRHGVSRASAYRWKRRGVKEGLEGLKSESRRPKRTRQMPDREQWKARVERERSRWRGGAKKLVMALRKRYGKSPSQASVGRMLRELGLVGKRRPRCPRAIEVLPSRLTLAGKANEVWAVDFKGKFRTADREVCWVLTMSDLHSRYVLLNEVLGRAGEVETREAMSQCFRKYGLPEVIRTDNGQPFGCGSQGALGLTKLSAWWLQLGIRVEFIDLAAPYQNGSHERMHGSYRREALKPAAADAIAQQKHNEKWRHYFNQERGHESLGMDPPGKHYRPSERRYRVAREFKYPREWDARRVKSKGEISWQGRRRYIGEAFSGRLIGLEVLAPDLYHWRIWFGEIEIGHLLASDRGGMRARVIKRTRRRSSSAKTS